MRIRIVNETGVVNHTRIITENGEDITKYFKSLVIHFGLGQPVIAKAELSIADAELMRVAVDVVAELAIESQST
jgi:hypothetical protein